MRLEMGVINTLEGGRWKKVSPGGIQPLTFSRNSPCEKARAGSASHLHWGRGCLSSGAAAQNFLPPGGAEGTLAHGSALLLLILCLPAWPVAGPSASSPKVRRYRRTSAPAAEMEGASLAPSQLVAGFCSSGWTSTSFFHSPFAPKRVFVGCYGNASLFTCPS